MLPGRLCRGQVDDGDTSADGPPTIFPGPAGASPPLKPSLAQTERTLFSTPPTAPSVCF